MRNHPPPPLPYALTRMKPGSLNLDYMNEREDAWTRRKSDVSSTASETARSGGIITRRSKPQRIFFSPSPSTASSQDLYPRFLKLFRHAFGNKRSPFRKQAQAWLSSLGKKNICSNCWQTRWKCDTQELRCRSCSERHATCPRTLQFKKFFIMREMHITEDAYNKLVEQIPRRKNQRHGASSSSSSHPPSRQSHQVHSKSKQKRVKSVRDEVESEEEMDELDPSEPSSDDLPLQLGLSSNIHPAPSPIPLFTPGPTYVNRSMEATTRLTQVRPARVTFRTTHRGPKPRPASTSNSSPSSAPMATASIDSNRVINELSGIRLALTRMEENISKFLSNHANTHPLGMTDRGTHIPLSNPSPTIVSESLPAPNSELRAAERFEMNTLDSGITGENTETENVENTWYTKTSRERRLPRSTNDQILGESSDLTMRGRFMTPAHVLPMIVTLDD